MFLSGNQQSGILTELAVNDLDILDSFICMAELTTIGLAIDMI